MRAWVPWRSVKAFIEEGLGLTLAGQSLSVLKANLLTSCRHVGKDLEHPRP